jgi:hypothetical protein
MAQLDTTQKILLTADPRTAATSANPNGVPAPLDGDPTWSFDLILRASWKSSLDCPT